MQVTLKCKIKYSLGNESFCKNGKDFHHTDSLLGISTCVYVNRRSGWFPAAYTEQVLAVTTG